MTNEEESNERLYNLLRELLKQEATLRELSNGKVLLLQAKMDIFKTIEENEAERNLFTHSAINWTLNGENTYTRSKKK